MAILWPYWPYPWPSSSATRPWDDGITHRKTIVSVDETFLAVPVVFVAEKIIRVKNEGYEDDLIESYIRAATELAEHETQTVIRPTRIAEVASGTPWGGYVLSGRPVRAVVSLGYYDSDQALQTLSGSPEPWVLVPSGPDSPAVLHPEVSGTWPSVATRQDAFTVTYDAGYATPEEIPAMLKTGIGLVAAELYKNPDLSNDLGMAANVLNLSRFFVRRW